MTRLLVMLVVLALPVFGPGFQIPGQNAAQGEPGPEHGALATFVGEWQVWLGSSDEPASGDPIGNATALMRLGGRFLEFELEATAGPIRQAIYTFGFDRRHKLYTVVAMDNTGTYQVTGRGMAEGPRIAMYGTDEDPVMLSMGFEKEFAIALHLVADDHIAIETIFIDTRTPERTEMPFLTFELRR